MSFRETALKKLASLCRKLGKANDPLYAVVVIAICKGTFRPIFSLADKKESPETRKYTAIREALTEAVAIPAYICNSKLAEKFAPKFVKPKPNVDPAVNLLKVKKVLSFLAICGTAVFVIPYLCNLTIKPVMDKLVKNKKKAENIPENNPIAPNNSINPSFTSIHELNGKNNQTQISGKNTFVNTYARPASVSAMRVGS